jgi:hypothetical protein
MPPRNKVDQLLTDLMQSPANLVFVPDNSPLWPQIARLSIFNILEVKRTDAGVAGVRLIETDFKRINAARNRSDERALDELARVNGAGWQGKQSPHVQAFKRLAHIGIITRGLALRTENGKSWYDIHLQAGGVDYFPAPAKSKVLRLTKGKRKK